jgi:serine/arginine repetitive matrix protein 2
MSANRYPDNNRYVRDRSPYRDRRPSNFGGGYPPRGNDSIARPNPESGPFPPRDPPRGPKSLGDAPRGPAVGPPSSAPSAPRDARGRGFAGRGEDTPLRTAPPLSSGTAANSHNSWRADRDRDRDREFDRRERRPTPPRRSPIRDLRDPRDLRDFVPRDIDISRARRNSRDGPSSAGSTYSDPPPLGAGSTYRGSGIGRGRGGRDFAGRGRPFHNDERDRHHDPRDRTWRPRSRSPPPIRRERDIRDERRDERDIERRERDDRRFAPREYDSYIGPAGAAKPGLRTLDTHRGPGPSDSRYVPGTPTGPTPHVSHHVSPSDRAGPQVDSYSRRSSVAVDPSSAKDRRDPGKDDALLASRAEASRERYAPRPSSPPAAVPAFGSNVWRAPVPDVKPSTAPTAPPKPAMVAPTTPIVSIPPPVGTTPVVPAAPKISLPNGPPTVPPTGPKAERASDRSVDDTPSQEQKPASTVPARLEESLKLSSNLPAPVASTASAETVEFKAPALQPNVVNYSVPSAPPPPPPPPPAAAAAAAAVGTLGPSVPSGPSTFSGPSRSPPQGPAAKPRPPPIAPQAAYRANTSPQFSRTPFPPYAPRDASPNANPAGLGPRSAGAPPISTSPKSLPANIPTGPKADRTPMAPRPPPMYPPSDRLPFSGSRAPISGGPKSMQWVRPGLIPNRPSVPSKREFPNDERDRSFGTAPKAPRLEISNSNPQLQRIQSAKSESTLFPRALPEPNRPRERAVSAERPTAASPMPGSIEIRRHSDVFMAEASPRLGKPPMSATSSAPEVLQDSDDDLDLDEGDFAGSEAKYNRERELLEARKVDLSAHHLRAMSPLHEIMLLHALMTEYPTEVIGEAEAAPLDEDVTMQDDVLPPQKVSVSDCPAPEESIATEPLTPRREDGDDVIMDENEEEGERAPAPATIALRLRRGMSVEQDTMPDLSTLPYLGSGPPTPLSDIEQDRPKLPESVMSAIRNKLRKSIEPELSTEENLQQYATLYRQWRQNTRPLDEEREQEELERQPSAEPSLKATTPDVTTAAMTGLLEPLPSATGRRSHSSRWATELDLEQVIKESLKTAEEERMGKREKDPKRAMADPEKEADLPLEMFESEAQRRRYHDTNFQREPSQGLFVFHYEPPEDDFTEEEHKVMVQNYRDQYAKKWGKLAEIIYKEVGVERTYKDCINHYYATKWGREYKGKIRRGRGGRRGGRTAGRGRGAIANMERPEPAEDGLPLPLTETGRPRRSAAPTFGGMEADFDPSAAATPGRARRQTDADGTQDKVGRRGKTLKEKGRGKAKNMPLAAAPIGSPVKVDRKEKGLGVKTEDEFGKRPLGDMPMPMAISVQPSLIEDQIMFPGESLAGMPMNMMDRPKGQPSARPGPSSYWSVSELQDFDKNVAHFGTDWIAIANHMGTKTHTMIKNQYLRLIEQGRADLEQVAKEADARRERGDHLGPPPTPTPAPKRRYESTQTALPRQIAPTPELHKSPLVNPLAIPKTTPPHSVPSSRFSTIAQAPVQGKPLVSVSSFPTMPETSLASIPSISQQQSPPAPAPAQRPQSQHQHSLSQQKPQHPGPRAGYFSDEVTSRHDNRPPSQSSHQPSRLLQQHTGSAIRPQEPHQSHPYRGFGHHERENLIRSKLQQEQEAQAQAQHRYQQHSRRISQEMNHQRPLGAGGIPPLAPPVRSNSIVRSPEHRSMSYSHSRHPSQAQQLNQPPPDLHPQQHSNIPAAQQMPSRSTILTPPVKEEPRPPPQSAIPQAPVQHLMQSQYGQTPVQSASAPLPKPTPEPRKSNLMSLLNDTETEEPRRKKMIDSGPPSHSTTPQQQTPIAPPPPPPTSQAQALRRNPYEDPYGRPSYAQQSSLPSASSNRPIDLTNDHPPNARPSLRDSWQPRQTFSHNQGQQPASMPSSQSGLSQPPYSESRMLSNHRAVFSQHNTARHNPSPPPHSVFNNSPHMHSRTPSVSGLAGQPSRHGIPSTTASQQASAASASALVLQPNPYAQVDPPGSSAPTPGPMGMRPSPHLHTSHIAQQRDSSGRNEHSQSHNASLSYSNPPTPNEYPSHPPRGPSGLADPYRPRDPREHQHEFEGRHISDRDTGRELSQRSEHLREHMSNPPLRATPMHEDLRYAPHQQDRGYMSQRSHTPLSRSEHGQPPPLQHPPHSSLGANNHSLYGQRPPEEPQQRFTPFESRGRSLTERIREDQAQQQAAMQREEYARRESESQREMQMRDAHMRESLRRDMRGPMPPGSAPGSGQDQRPPAGPGPHDWASAVRHPNDRSAWPR